MIGVDVDQSGQFDTVITSATKGLAQSVNEALTDSMNNGWKFSETYSGKGRPSSALPRTASACR